MGKKGNIRDISMTVLQFLNTRKTLHIKQLTKAIYRDFFKATCSRILTFKPRVLLGVEQLNRCTIQLPLDKITHNIMIFIKNNPIITLTMKTLKPNYQKRNDAAPVITR